MLWCGGVGGIPTPLSELEDDSPRRPWEKLGGSVTGKRTSLDSTGHCKPSEVRETGPVFGIWFCCHKGAAPS